MVKWGNAPFSKRLRVTQMRDPRQPIGSAIHFPTGTITLQAAEDGLLGAGQHPRSIFAIVIPRQEWSTSPRVVSVASPS